MQWNYRGNPANTRHKVFISYYHYNDECYRNEFEKLFGHLFVNKSVQIGDIDTDNSTEYVKRLIQTNYITDTSVLVVLVGVKTYCRKHVDWEISAALNKKVGGYSGLVGLLLPTHPDYSKSHFNPETVPPRLVDNIRSGYANLYPWTTSEEDIRIWINQAFDNRVGKSGLINNHGIQFINNRCS
jgi:hypothetical protein